MDGWMVGRNQEKEEGKSNFKECLKQSKNKKYLQKLGEGGGGGIAFAAYPLASLGWGHLYRIGWSGEDISEQKPI
jgi:glycerate kinase